LGHVAETAIFAQRFHYPQEHLHDARWKKGTAYQDVDLVKLDPALKAESAIEIKFTDRVVKQAKTWTPWLDFCHKNRLRDLTITTRTEQRQTEVSCESVADRGNKIEEKSPGGLAQEEAHDEKNISEGDDEDRAWNGRAGACFPTRCRPVDFEVLGSVIRDQGGRLDVLESACDHRFSDISNLSFEQCSRFQDRVMRFCSNGDLRGAR